MRKRFLPILLALSLICGMTGCGKAESDIETSGGGDAVDLGGGLGSDAVDLSGESEDDGSSGRTQIQDDHIIVNVPTISYEDFGNGFYDEYVVDYGPLSEKTYDEDGLLTGARHFFVDMLDPKESRITLNYEKNDGMVTACEISADMYGWYLCEYYLNLSKDEAREENQKAQRRMPYRLEFQEPVPADPDMVKEAILRRIEEIEKELDQALLPPIDAYNFYDAFTAMYLEAMGGAGDAGQTDGSVADGAEADEPEEATYNEDGLLTGVRIGLETESGETAESWITVLYEKEGGQVTACELDADMYSFFVYEFGMDEESAKEWSEELSDKMPVRLVFDEPVDPDPGMIADWIFRKLEENVDSDVDKYFIEAFYGVYEEYGFGGVVETGDASETSEQIDIGGNIKARFRKKMNGNDLAVNYIDGGSLTGEMKIDNQPFWSSDMSVSQEEIVCQIETEQDTDGNLTLVRLYNDYAFYDYVFTYDSAGRMVRYEYYEYPKGQSREAVGVIRHTEYSYDGAGRLVKKETQGTQANRVDSATEYYYDDMGRLAARIDTVSFLGNDFMTSQQTYDSVAQSYEYDDTGKVILMSVTVDWAQTVIHEEPPAPTTVMYFPAR